VVRTLVRPTIILSTTWLPFSNPPIQKFIRFFKKQGWIHGKSRKQILFSYKKYQFFLILWARVAFCGLKYAGNAIAAGVPPRTPLGELTTLSQTP